MTMLLKIYDTTLRDGTQREGISLSVEDKIKITHVLDELGVHYIEGGWPGSNPKDAEFFRRMQSTTLQHAKIAAFGSTRHAKSTCDSDANTQALLAANTPVVTLVGKSSVLHVEHVLETTRDENIRMIADSVAYFVGHGKEVIYDAEHFLMATCSTQTIPWRRLLPLLRLAHTQLCCVTPTVVHCRMISPGL